MPFAKTHQVSIKKMFDSLNQYFESRFKSGKVEINTEAFNY